MPKKKRDERISSAEAESEAVVSLEQEIESTTPRSGVGGLVQAPLSPQGNNVQVLRDNFDNDAAALLTRVKSVLENILNDPDADAKSKLTAAKLILQTNGLLERRSTMDQETVTAILDRITRRTQVSIRDITESS